MSPGARGGSVFVSGSSCTSVCLTVGVRARSPVSSVVCVFVCLSVFFNTFVCMFVGSSSLVLTESDLYIIIFQYVLSRLYSFATMLGKSSVG